MPESPSIQILSSQDAASIAFSSRRRFAFHKGGSFEIRKAETGILYTVLVFEKLNPAKLTKSEHEQIATALQAEEERLNALKARLN